MPAGVQWGVQLCYVDGVITMQCYWASLIGGISDTCSQGYTDLQSLVKCMGLCRISTQVLLSVGIPEHGVSDSFHNFASGLNVLLQHSTVKQRQQKVETFQRS